MGRLAEGSTSPHRVVCRTFHSPGLGSEPSSPPIEVSHQTSSLASNSSGHSLALCAHSSDLFSVASSCVTFTGCHPSTTYAGLGCRVKHALAGPPSSSGACRDRAIARSPHIEHIGVCVPKTASGRIISAVPVDSKECGTQSSLADCSLSTEVGQMRKGRKRNRRRGLWPMYRG